MILDLDQAREERGGDGPSEALVGLVEVRRGRMSALQLAEGGRSLLARLGWGRRAPNVRRRWIPAIAAALVVTGLVVAVFGAKGAVHHLERPISVAVDGGRVDRAGVISAEPAVEPRLHFSDGTEVRLTQGAQASVRSMSAHGARVAIAEGAAQVDVVHRPGAAWSFDAGPFHIAVTGTAFRVGWSTAAEELDLRMERGSVEVSGPLSDGPLLLRAGQHLIARVRQRETLIRDRDDEEETPLAAAPVVARDEAPPVPPPAAPPISRAVERSERARPARAAPASCSESHDWATELSAGDFEGIVHQAEHAGVDRCLNEAGASDLAALADAARYDRRDDVARRAMLAERLRFPQTRPARDATFLLGRLDEADDKASQAIVWYRRYLSENPAGTYASEALGRTMNLVERVSGPASVRPFAEEYLRRFPQGTYAVRARSLTLSP